MNHKSRAILRGISLLVLQVFALQQIASAAPASLAPQRFEFSQKPPIELNLAESVARVEDAYRAPQSDKLIVLFQDAHTNESGQMNLAKALDHVLKQEDIRYVFTEAGKGDDSLSFIKRYGTPKSRKEVGLAYLRKGIIKGAEYLNFTSDHDFVIWGVEDFDLYHASLETYRTVVRERRESKTYLSRIGASIRIIKSKVYNPLLMAFDEAYQKYLKNEISLTDYFGVLEKHAKRESIDLKAFPNLAALRKIQDQEKKIDFIQASREQLAAIKSLTKEDQELLNQSHSAKQSAFKISHQSIQDKEAYYLLLTEKLGDMSGYPELGKYIGYLEASQDLDAHALLTELDLLEEKVFDALTTNENEARLVKASWFVGVLNGLFDLTLTPDDFNALQHQTPDMDYIRMAGTINKMIMDLGNHHERVVILKEGFEDLIQKAVSFYLLTYRRDRTFVERIVGKMNETGDRKAVLVTGGYHTPNIKNLLKEQGISFIVVTPQVYHTTDHSRYERLLLGQEIIDDETVVLAADKRSAMQSSGLMLVSAVRDAQGQQHLLELIRQTIVTSNLDPTFKDQLLSVFEAEVQRVAGLIGGARSSSDAIYPSESGQSVELDQSPIGTRALSDEDDVKLEEALNRQLRRIRRAYLAVTTSATSEPAGDEAERDIQRYTAELDEHLEKNEDAADSGVIGSNFRKTLSPIKDSIALARNREEGRDEGRVDQPGARVLDGPPVINPEKYKWIKGRLEGLRTPTGEPIYGVSSPSALAILLAIANNEPEARNSYDGLDAQNDREEIERAFQLPNPYPYVEQPLPSFEQILEYVTEPGISAYLQERVDSADTVAVGTRIRASDRIREIREAIRQVQIHRKALVGFLSALEGGHDLVRRLRSATQSLDEANNIVEVVDYETMSVRLRAMIGSVAALKGSIQGFLHPDVPIDQLHQLEDVTQGLKETLLAAINLIPTDADDLGVLEKVRKRVEQFQAVRIPSLIGVVSAGAAGLTIVVLTGIPTLAVAAAIIAALVVSAGAYLYAAQQIKRLNAEEISGQNDAEDSGTAGTRAEALRLAEDLRDQIAKPYADAENASNRGLDINPSESSYYHLGDANQLRSIYMTISRIVGALSSADVLVGSKDAPNQYEDMYNDIKGILETLRDAKEATDRDPTRLQDLGLTDAIKNAENLAEQLLRISVLYDGFLRELRGEPADTPVQETPVSIAHTKVTRDTLVSDLKISTTSAKNALQAGIGKSTPAAALEEYSREELLAIPGFDERSFQEMLDQIGLAGIHLSSGGEDIAADNPTNDQNISTLKFVLRITKALNRLGIRTIGQLRRRTERKLMRIYNFGESSLWDVRGKLAEIGVYLHGDEPVKAHADGAPIEDLNFSPGTNNKLQELGVYEVGQLKRRIEQDLDELIRAIGDTAYTDMHQTLLDNGWIPDETAPDSKTPGTRAEPIRSMKDRDVKLFIAAWLHHRGHSDEFRAIVEQQGPLDGYALMGKLADLQEELGVNSYDEMLALANDEAHGIKPVSFDEVVKFATASGKGYYAGIRDRVVGIIDKSKGAGARGPKVMYVGLRNNGPLVIRAVANNVERLLREAQSFDPRTLVILGRIAGISDFRYMGYTEDEEARLIDYLGRQTGLVQDPGTITPGFLEIIKRSIKSNWDSPDEPTLVSPLDESEAELSKPSESEQGDVDEDLTPDPGARKPALERLRLFVAGIIAAGVLSLLPNAHADVPLYNVFEPNQVTVTRFDNTGVQTRVTTRDESGQVIVPAYTFDGDTQFSRVRAARQKFEDRTGGFTKESQEALIAWQRIKDLSKVEAHADLQPAGLIDLSIFEGLVDHPDEFRMNLEGLVHWLLKQKAPIYLEDATIEDRPLAVKVREQALEHLNQIHRDIFGGPLAGVGGMGALGGRPDEILALDSQDVVVVEFHRVDQEIKLKPGTFNRISLPLALLDPKKTYPVYHLGRYLPEAAQRVTFEAGVVDPASVKGYVQIAANAIYQSAGGRSALSASQLSQIFNRTLDQAHRIVFGAMKIDWSQWRRAMEWMRKIAIYA